MIQIYLIKKKYLNINLKTMYSPLIQIQTSIDLFPVIQR